MNENKPDLTPQPNYKRLAVYRVDLVSYIIEAFPIRQMWEEETETGTYFIVAGLDVGGHRIARSSLDGWRFTIREAVEAALQDRVALDHVWYACLGALTRAEQPRSYDDLAAITKVPRQVLEIVLHRMAAEGLIVKTRQKFKKVCWVLKENYIPPKPKKVKGVEPPKPAKKPKRVETTEAEVSIMRELSRFMSRTQKQLIDISGLSRETCRRLLLDLAKRRQIKILRQTGNCTTWARY